MRLICALICLLAVTWEHAPGDEDRPTVATGVVFHDSNGNGTRDAGEPGLTGVRVSNGREIGATDESGAYRLPIGDDTILFVIKPRGWMTHVDELNLPRFYYIHKPDGSPKLRYPGVVPTGTLPPSVDFALHPQDEPERFDVLVFGDTQPHSIAQVDYLAHDLVEQVIGTEAVFVLSLGDLVSNKLELFAPLNRVMAHIGVPLYNVLGNHDMNYAAPDDRHSDETFESVYGPPYYSFDYGPVHFVVLDDVVWHGATEDKDGYYRAGLGERQLEFLRNDLKLADRDQLVVLTMHIPIEQIQERQELFALLGQHAYTLSFSAHTHIQQHLFYGQKDGWPGPQPHHHANVATSCGCWWRGALDEVGIPHATMSCGAPNGWSVVTFEKNRYSIRFQPARRPAGYQMNIYAPEVVVAAAAGQTEVLVNVFAGSERSTVQMRLDVGEWVALERVVREDPYYLALKHAEEGEHAPRGTKLPKASKSPHLWRGTLPAGPAPGTHLIEVRTTDMFGQSYVGRRLIRIE
jgi:hypothetical protein